VPLQGANLVPRPRPQAGPADVPRQMMDALDKYSQMQLARGARVDASH
jgi:hypothetical protein